MEPTIWQLLIYACLMVFGCVFSFGLAIIGVIVIWKKMYDRYFNIWR